MVAFVIDAEALKKLKGDDFQECRLAIQVRDGWNLVEIEVLSKSGKPIMTIGLHPNESDASASALGICAAHIRSRYPGQTNFPAKHEGAPSAAKGGLH